MLKSFWSWVSGRLLLFLYGVIISGQIGNALSASIEYVWARSFSGVFIISLISVYNGLFLKTL